LLDHNLIIIGIIFLAAVGLTIWSLSAHRFQGLIFVSLWLLGAAPNLTLALAAWDLEGVIMAFFNSIPVYILFTIYLGVVLYKRFVPRGAFARKGQADTDLHTDLQKYKHLLRKVIEENQKKFQG